MKRVVRRFVGVALVVLAIVIWLIAKGDPVKTINEQLQAATGQLQLKRALTLSESTLETLAPVDLLIVINSSDLKRLEPTLKLALESARALKEVGIQVTGVELGFARQSLSAAIGVTIPMEGEVDVHATVHASALIGASPSALHWNLRYDGLSVDHVETTYRLDEVVIGAIVKQLTALTPLLNAALDEMINDNPESAVLLRLNQDRIIAENLANFSQNRLTIEPHEISWSLRLESTGIWIDKEGIVLASRIAFVPPDEAAINLPDFPSDDSLVAQDDDGVQARIGAYQGRFMGLIEDAFPDDTGAELRSRTITGVALTTRSLSRLFNRQFGAGVVKATLSMTESSSSSSELTFAINQRNCREVFDACDYRDVCDRGSCKQTVRKQISKTCKYRCCLQFGLIGCLIPGWCDEACDEFVAVIEDVDSPVCEAFRTADKLHLGVLCDVASNLDKAVCDIEANARKALCDVGQEVRRFYESNPVATVRAELQPNLTLHAQIANATLTDDLGTLSAELSASGAGQLSARLKYDKHNYTQDILTAGLTLGLTCVADWTESVDVEVSAQVESIPVAFTSTFETTEKGVLNWRLRQANPITLYADFSPSPLVALFGGKPQVALNCPLLMTGALVWATGEAVFTQEKARQVLPLLTGENFPQTIENETFEISIKPLRICPLDGECKKPWAELFPRLGHGVITFTQLTR